MVTTIEKYGIKKCTVCGAVVDSTECEVCTRIKTECNHCKHHTGIKNVDEYCGLGMHCEFEEK